MPRLLPVPFRRRAALAAAAVVLAVPAAGGAAAAVLEEVVVRVNDAIITRSEYEKRRAQVAAGLRSSGSENVDELLAEALDKLLLNMINEELLIQQAELNFDMDKYYERLRRDFMQMNEIATESDLVAMLEGEGMDVPEFRRLLLRNNVPQDVIQFEITRKLSVSPREIQDYFESHRDEFTDPGTVTLREIVVLDGERGAAAARARVDEILSRLESGESFESLARELSDSPSAEKGGLVGPYRRGDLVGALEDQAFSLDVGAVGEPIDTGYGFHLLQVESRNEDQVQTLDDVRDIVEAEVRRDKYEKEFDAYMARLWRENRIDLNPRYATGVLADGGPYVDRDDLISASAPVGPPLTPPAGAAGGR